mgnify:FL=1
MFVSITVVGLAVGVTVVRRAGEEPAAARRGGGTRVAAVEVAEVSRGRLEERRVFSGTLTPSAALRVAPKISGRIARILVDISDEVSSGDEIALLDDAEFAQAVNSARADLVVASAQAAEALNRFELAERELRRVETLEARGVASAAALDTAQSEYLMRKAALEVARAQVQAREAALATAEIRLSHTRVTAVWSDHPGPRLVGERFADEGDTVAANTALLSVVNLQPIRTIFFVPERDFGLLERGQQVMLETDAFPGEQFAGEISRIAPVFREDSRQARVEVVSTNEDRRLKPGMFVRATVVLRAVEDAVQVPLEALTRRGGEEGVFLVNGDGDSVSWVPLRTGIRTRDRVEVLEGELDGQVVTLGQQFLSDGTAIRISEGRARR